MNVNEKESSYLEIYLSCSFHLFFVLRLHICGYLIRVIFVNENIKRADYQFPAKIFFNSNRRSYSLRKFINEVTA